MPIILKATSTAELPLITIEENRTTTQLDGEVPYHLEGELPLQSDGKIPIILE